MKNVTVQRNFGFRVRMRKNADIIHRRRNKGRKELARVAIYKIR